MKILSFLLLLLSLYTKGSKPLLALLFTQLLFFLITKNSFRLFFKRVIFIVPALLGILVLNHKIFILVSLKSLVSLLAMSVLTSNFDIGKMTQFLKRTHTPNYLIEIFILAFRYSHTFVDEVLLVKKNLWLRGSFSKKNILNSAFLGPLVGNLFIRSLKKSQKVHQAMKLRGY